MLVTIKSIIHGLGLQISKLKLEATLIDDRIINSVWEEMLNKKEGGLCHTNQDIEGILEPIWADLPINTDFFFGFIEQCSFIN